MLLAGLVGVLPGCTSGSPHEPQPAATAPSSAAKSPYSTPDVAQVEFGQTKSGPPAPPSATPPQWISYPAAGIELAVLPLTPSSGELTTRSLVPPQTTDAYWLTNYGRPGASSSNTTYIVGHSWENAEASFNRLSSHSAIGDELSVTTGTGPVKYKVRSVTTHDKNTLRTSDVWDKVPGRLVLISCYTEDILGKNVIVTAMPSP